MPGHQPGTGWSSRGRRLGHPVPGDRPGTFWKLAGTPHCVFAKQHFLYFFPLPQGQGSLRPILGIPRLIGLTLPPCSEARTAFSSAPFAGCAKGTFGAVTGSFRVREAPLTSGLPLDWTRPNVCNFWRLSICFMALPGRGLTAGEGLASGAKKLSVI